MEHNAESVPLEFDEGDEVFLRVRVYRASREQALIEFVSMEGTYSIRVPLSELTHSVTSPGDRSEP